MHTHTHIHTKAQLIFCLTELIAYNQQLGLICQGVQGTVRLPEIDVPCPQGVQGQDCAQFKLWLENCHRFGLHDCRQQLQGFQSGRLSLAQLFAEQESTIKQVREKGKGQGREAVFICLCYNF